MNQLTKVFEKQDLTIIEVEGDFHFLLNDVCKILEIGNPRNVKARLEDDVHTTYPIRDRLGRIQQATFVNEDGLYDVILDSRKPEAKRFRKWLTSEVLPSIRKTGGYQMQQPSNSLELALHAALEHEREIKEIKSDVGYLMDNMRINGPQEQRIGKNARARLLSVSAEKNLLHTRLSAERYFHSFGTSLRVISRFRDMESCRKFGLMKRWTSFESGRLVLR